ncbi:hypothetical protein [Peribacillus deserti]|nr:hypothetical protein [Peribacillus deserti]
MDYYTSAWHCTKCPENGTMFNLIQTTKDESQPTAEGPKKIYNPKIEIYKIKKLFMLLIKENENTSSEKKLAQLFEKVLDLIEEVNL